MKAVKFLLVALILATSTTAVMAQKLAFVKQNEILQKLMVKDSVQQKRDAYVKELTEVSETMQVEFNTKLQEYQKNQATYSDAVKGVKEKELQRLSQSLEEFIQTSQQNIQVKEGELMQPVIDKFRAAADKVGKAGGYAMIFDLNSQIFVNESQLTNLTDAITKELGL